MALSWALVIATYKREAILQRCLKLAAEQTRKPREIVVVDASPYWETTRERVMATLAPTFPEIEWRYFEAEAASAGAQRAQGSELADSDVLFLIDDDSLMYPTCAERMLDVYERDPEGRIAGMMPLLTRYAPDTPEGANGPEPFDSASAGAPSLKDRLRGRLVASRDWLKGPLIPNELSRLSGQTLPDLGVSWNEIEAIHGCRMSFRRSALLENNFDRRMLFCHEETELALRIRRRGLLICIHEPLICHVEELGKLLKRRGARWRAFWLLSQAYMCRKLMSDPAHARRVVRTYGRGTRAVDLVTGVLNRDLQPFRGAMACKADVEAILNAPEDRYGEVYSAALAKWRQKAS